MAAKIITIIILITFFSAFTYALIWLLKQKSKKRKIDYTLLLIFFISSVFSGFALFEFVKQL